MNITPDLRAALRLVALLNLAYFALELVIALRIGSVSLLADSADFFEDAAVNSLILAALSLGARPRARVGIVLALVLLAPAAAFVWMLWRKLQAPAPPDPGALSFTGLGALAVNLFCAFVLVRFRGHAGSLTKAAFLSARNDAAANVAIIAAGLVTLATRSVWPDIVVGFGVAALNIDAARQVLTAARLEHRQTLQGET